MKLIKKIQGGRHINEFVAENFDEAVLNCDTEHENFALRREVAMLRRQNEALNKVIGYIEYCAMASPATAFTCDILLMLEACKK